MSGGEKKGAVTFVVTYLFPGGHPHVILHVRSCKRGRGTWKSLGAGMCSRLIPPRRQLLKALAHQDAYAVVFLSGSYWPGLTRGAW